MTHHQRAIHELLLSEKALDPNTREGALRRAQVHATLAIVEILGDANAAVERAIAIPEAEVVEDDRAA